MQVNYKTITTLEFDIFTGGYKKVEKQVEDTQNAFTDNAFAELLAGSGFGDDASPVKTSNADFFALSESQENLSGDNFGVGLNVGGFGGVNNFGVDNANALNGGFNSNALNNATSGFGDNFNVTNSLDDGVLNGKADGFESTFENNLMANIYELRFNAFSTQNSQDANLQTQSNANEQAQSTLIRDLLNMI